MRYAANLANKRSSVTVNFHLLAGHPLFFGSLFRPAWEIGRYDRQWIAASSMNS